MDNTETSKPIWASKTFWVNAVTLSAGIFAMLGMDFLNMEMQGEIVVVAVTVANITLRFITKEPVSLSGSK